MRPVAALLVLLLSACAAPRVQQKMSFDELYDEPSSRSAPARPKARPQAKKTDALVQEMRSPELKTALVTFVSLARATRTKVQQGSPMPLSQVENWEQMNATLDAFLSKPARKTASLDVVRARVTLEAELEEDARAYGDMPAELADGVLARMEQLAVRMAELRQLQLKPSRKGIRFAWPVDPVHITSVFGSRVHPITGEDRNHLGLDLGAKPGQHVMAAAGGVVLRAGWNGSHGNQVVIQHDGEVTTRYSHLSRLLVEPGDVVEPGDIVGAAGKTGLATGVHLHFEVWRKEEPCDPLDELGPTPSGEEPNFVSSGSSESGAGTRKGRRPTVGQRP